MNSEDPYIREVPPSNPYAAPLAEDPERPFDPTLTGRTLNPWVSIWTQPRATVRQIVETDPRYMVLPIVLMTGLSTGLSGAADSATDPQLQAISGFSVGTTVGAVIGGLVFMPLFWLFNAWLMRITAHWIGGRANLVETRAAYAWGTTPSLFAMPITLLALLLVFQVGPDRVQGLVAIRQVTEGVLAIWTFVTLCKCLGEVNRFSAWRGLGAMILAGLLVAVPMMVIVFLFVVGGAAFSM
ncbi:Yip1 domain protein [Posidoniimonas polymericola]|uniref:Yip1 domain protein n=1 Tax=Posidoniimonas polymericola TaxID=2528002 RepID=A0A5C5XRB3_9BACT|nr:Yip1 family protein [Posidoniimonas polymericola]TWT65430.1 Yip1 domain protein [Posidoniimonas polymericola]